MKVEKEDRKTQHYGKSKRVKRKHEERDHKKKKENSKKAYIKQV